MPNYTINVVKRNDRKKQNDIKEEEDEIILKRTLCTVAGASVLYLPRH